jgi:hypothetical protein
MTEHEMKPGDIFNTSVRSGWQKWILAYIHMVEGKASLSFYAKKEGGKPDPKHTLAACPASNFRYNSEDGEYYEIERDNKRK